MGHGVTRPKVADMSNEDRDIDVRIILKWIFKKWYGDEA